MLCIDGHRDSDVHLNQPVDDGDDDYNEDRAPSICSVDM